MAIRNYYLNVIPSNFEVNIGDGLILDRVEIDATLKTLFAYGVGAFTGEVRDVESELANKFIEFGMDSPRSTDLARSVWGPVGSGVLGALMSTKHTSPLRAYDVLAIGPEGVLHSPVENRQLQLGRAA